jgi:Crinkler effector protein N-terminal domain
MSRGAAALTAPVHYYSCSQRQMYKLNCIVLGDNSERVFRVDIVRAQTIGDLREVIKHKKKPEFDVSSYGR